MRRAWIEIVSRRRFNEAFNVALHAESVDRNLRECGEVCALISRSPCGERG